MSTARTDEWSVIERLLPRGWREAARETGAFRRARYLDDPGPLLRLLLFHAINDCGLRETVAQARASGIVAMSQVALLKRLRSSGAWLSWLGAELCRVLRREPQQLPQGLRLRIVDSTTVQGPASKGTDWRVHYALDLASCTCDWFEVTDRHGGERLDRTPVAAGDLIIADRNYLQPVGVRSALKVGAHVLIRLRLRHSQMTMADSGEPFHALSHARKLRVGKIGSWRVQLSGSEEKGKEKRSPSLPGRVLALKLPAPLAAKAKRRALRNAERKGRRLTQDSLEAAQLIMLFTTVGEDLLTDTQVLELYRYRWQVELAFKRLKQLLRLGRLPHKDPAAAKSWILAKLVVALLMETLFRNARTFSPWGYDIQGNARADRRASRSRRSRTVS